MEFDNSMELYHHGIKGMKWGVRRFQNKDGSLTNAGGKRYNGSDYKPRRSITQTIRDYRTASKRKKNLAKAREAAAEKRKAEAEAKAKAEQRRKDVEEGKISARNMTADELNSRINKLNLEKRYKQLMEETNPEAKAKSIGNGFVKKMWNDAVVPAMAEAGKQILKDQLIKAASKKSKTEINSEVLDRMAKDWKNRAEIAKEKKNAWKNEYDLNQLKKKDQENIRRAEEAKKQAEEKAKEAKVQAEEKAKNEKKWQKEVDDYNNSGYKDDRVKSDNNPSNNNKNTNTEFTRKPLLGDGVERVRTTADDVIGEGKSGYEYSWQGARYYDHNPKWRDVSASSKTYSSSVSAGQKYLSTTKSSPLSLPYKSSASENSNSNATDEKKKK